VADRIKGLISVLAPEALCDGCIAERLGLGAPHQASHGARELAGEHGFERRKAACAICGEVTIVTRRKMR
jgi:ribosomal protein L37E